MEKTFGRVAAIILGLVGAVLTACVFVLSVMCFFDPDNNESHLGSMLRQTMIVWRPLSCMAVFVIPAVTLWQGVRTLKLNRQVLITWSVFAVCLVISWQSSFPLLSQLHLMHWHPPKVPADTRNVPNTPKPPENVRFKTF